MRKKPSTASRTIIAVVVLLATVYVVWSLVARALVRTDAAALVLPVLNAATRNTGTDADQMKIDVQVDKVLLNKSDAADEAVAILIAYNIGVHNAEELTISSTQRGQRMLTYLDRYRKSPPVPLRPEFWLLRLNRTTSDSMYDEAIGLIRQGKVLQE